MALTLLLLLLRYDDQGTSLGMPTAASQVLHFWAGDIRARVAPATNLLETPVASASPKPLRINSAGVLLPTPPVPRSAILLR